MLRGRIRCVKAKLPLDEKKLEVIDTTKTGDRILDEVLEVMATSASRAHSCGYWVDGACSPRKTLLHVGEKGEPARAMG